VVKEIIAAAKRMKYFFIFFILNLKRGNYLARVANVVNQNSIKRHNAGIHSGFDLIFRTYLYAMKIRFIGTACCLLFALFAHGQIQSGMWRMELTLNDSTKMSFNFEAVDNSIEIINADERIKVESIIYEGDSVFIRMPLFDSEFRMLMDSRHI
jgi:hypothetical protein